MVFQGRLPQGWRPGFTGSHLSYTSRALAQRQVGVKLHGVFLSCHGSPVSSPVIPISPSPLSRQRPDRSTFRAGRNLPDKEFRYLRTVIVTAAVYRGFGSPRRTAPLNLPALGRSQPLYVHALPRWQGPVFLVNRRLGLVTAAPSRSHRGTPRGGRSRYTGRPFSRSYGANLPSSLTGVLSSTLVFSTSPPVSVCGTGAPPWLEAFLGGPASIPTVRGRPLPLHSPLRSAPCRICLARLPTGLEGLRARDLAPRVPPSLYPRRTPETERARNGNLDPLSIAYGASPRLRPASPAADQHGCGTLGHSVGGIRTPLALLMPTFALPAAPPRFPPRLHC